MSGAPNNHLIYVAMHCWYDGEPNPTLNSVISIVGSDLHKLIATIRAHKPNCMILLPDQVTPMLEDAKPGDSYVRIFKGNEYELFYAWT